MAEPPLRIPADAVRSPDGTQWWDGQAWQPIADPIPADAVRSPDGTQWWDGAHWQPMLAQASGDIASPPGGTVTDDGVTVIRGAYRLMVRQDGLTDTTLAVYDTSHPDNQLPGNQLDNEGGRWAILCEEHDSYKNVATQLEARELLGYPEQVCDDCATALGTPSEILGTQGAAHTPFAVGAVIAVAGAVALTIGAFLPWLSASSLFGTLGRSGVDGGGDGLLFIAVAGIIGVVSYFAIRGSAKVWMALLLLLLGLIAGAMLGFEILDINKKIDAANGGGQGFVASLGAGLFVIGGGTAAIIVGAFFEMERAYYA